MSMPGDARIVFDVPPGYGDGRCATMTFGIVGVDGELGKTCCMQLRPHEEAEVNLMVAGLVGIRNLECGPSS